MNFFETELKKVMKESSILKDQKYVGRLCFGSIDADIRARIEFVTAGTSSRYEGIKASVINRKEGVVDSMLLRFSDVWGKKKVSSPNFKDGVMPHIWTDSSRKSDWYVFHPAKEDYRQLSARIERYLSVFQDMEMTQEQQNGIMQQM